MGEEVMPRGRWGGPEVPLRAEECQPRGGQSDGAGAEVVVVVVGI